MYIQIDENLHDSLKIMRFTRALGLRRFEATGILAEFWRHVFKTAPDGDVTDLTADDLAIVCDYLGDAPALFGALLDFGLIERDGERLLVHDWEHYSGTMRRSKAAERQRAYRERQRDGDGPSRDAHVTDTARDVTKRDALNGTERNGKETQPTPAKFVAVSAMSPAWSIYAAYMRGLDLDPATLDEASKKRHLATARTLKDFDPADVEGCTRHLNEQPFWRDRGVGLHNVAKELPKWITTGRPTPGAKAAKVTKYITHADGTRTVAPAM